MEQAQHVDRSAVPLLGGLFAAGVVSLGLLVRQENRAPSPLIPLSLLRRPTIWRSDALAAFHGAALVSLITFLPIYLEVVRGLSPAETGLLLVPLTIGIGTGSLLTGRLVSKTGRTTVFPVFGLALVTATLVVLAAVGAGAEHDRARMAAAVERIVHGNRDGRRAGHGAVGVRTDAARRSRGVGAVFPLDRRGVRDRAGDGGAVCGAVDEEPGGGARCSPP